ncbi:MAG: HAMP domain-containing sensor histidine kinase [Cyclobacteriaceae bacterium]
MVQEVVENAKPLLSSIKRNVLVGKICLFCIVLALLHILLDASAGLYESVAVDAAFAIVIAFSYLLNHWKFHKESKIFVLLSLNILFLLFASVLPQSIGIILYYFPLIVASSALFDSNEKPLRYLFNAIPLVLLTVLFVYDYRILGSVQFESPLNMKTFFAVNAFSSAGILIICVDFMQKLNESSEKELKQLAEEVRGKNTHLEKTNAELDRFLYSTSHDLRSPLSSIKGLINIARYETTDSKIQGYFTMMIDRVDKLDFFVKDIIDYSKNARTEVRSERVDFGSLVTEVTENLKFIEGAETITFENKVSFAQPVLADKNRFSVVLNNLMANAIKYHDPQKENQWIGVDVSNSNGAIKLIVSDNGMGISNEHLDKIFDMFYRGTFQSKGSGLGLYIVKETVSKMQGTIRVESNPGKGSSFLITVPVA